MLSDSPDAWWGLDLEVLACGEVLEEDIKKLRRRAKKKHSRAVRDAMDEKRALHNVVWPSSDEEVEDEEDSGVLLGWVDARWQSQTLTQV